MANTINDLYSKYTTKVGMELEDDRYFQYLYEMVQAGDNTLQQKNRILHKVVDERWLSVVEDSLDAIYNIIDKPRRFIATTEEVVPVALAKKITSDSVRHLSMNTQFIGTNAAGEIQPTKILNVTTEESFDLYENRFVYHLIQRLFTFVDKRTDVIFWSTGDEICNTMSMESKVDDAYEEISYKIEMTIKNRQSFAENDSDNMEVFKRIDRVRRMARALRTSSFCDIMAGCAKVRSPIQRTNLMMKDPDYRKCYKLWQFIESYDEVGYTIEERDSALEFDEEYLIQMYTNLITNYTVFKSLLESDPRKMTEIAVKQREPVKPKFIKEIKEEIVDDYNIPDVEVRKVIIEEVTQAQLDAEAKLKEEMSRREELEQSLSDLNWQMDSLNQQMEYLEDMKAQVEEQMAQLQQQLEEEKTARTAAEENAEKAKTEAEETIAAARLEAEKLADTAREEAKEIVDAAQKEIEETRRQTKAEADAQVAAAQKAADEKVAEAEKAAEKKVAEAKAQADASIAAATETAKQKVAETEKAAEQKVAEAEAKARDRITAAQESAEATVAQTQENADRMIAEAKEAAEKEMADCRREAKEQAQAQIEETNRSAQEQIQAARSEAEASVQAAKKEQEEAVEEARRQAEASVAEAQRQAKESVEEARRQAKESVAEAQRQAEASVQTAQKEQKEAVEAAQKAQKEAEARCQKAEKEKEKAIAKAEANSLSRYIRDALQERKERKNQKED